jgi:hypothetical protein
MPHPTTAYRVSDVDLASRLSFFLWSSIPDEELLRLAEQESCGNLQRSSGKSAYARGQPLRVVRE